MLSKKMFNSIVKAVVDIDREIMVIDAEMHCDQEEYLLNNGSLQENLWGINLHPYKYDTLEFIEFDFMINLRPSQRNTTRGVDDKAIQEKIMKVVSQWVE